MGKNKPKRRKQQRHVPVTNLNSGINKDGKKKKSHRVIAEIHKVNKEIEAIKGNKDLSKSDRAHRLSDLSEQKEELGGIAVYQKLSKGAEKHHGNYNTSQWVIEQLHNKGVLPVKDTRITLLDVGALDLNYTKYKTCIQCCSIDLNPQKSEILEANLLTFTISTQELFDVVVLSLVINFEGDLVKRGEMLRKAAQLCKLGGHIFIMLPRACLENSRYMTSELLDEMMKSLGCTLMTSHDTNKLSLRMFEKRNSKISHAQFLKKKLRSGTKRNNFCIILKTR